jgi:DNA polymerase-3 subunit delta
VSDSSASRRPVVVWIIHGDDSLAMSRLVTKAIATLGDATMIELNLTRLDGRTCSENDLRTAVLSMPFLAPHRVVILSNPLGRYKEAAAKGRFTQLLDSIPETTRLVMVVDDFFERKNWTQLPEDSFLHKWSARAKVGVRIDLCQLPTQGSMPGWIIKQAREQKGEFAPDAAAALAELVGNETQIAIQEITKLLTYVNFARKVEKDDVDNVAASGGTGTIFQLTDALTAGNATESLKRLHFLLETNDTFAILGMIISQYRLLLQARQTLDAGGNADTLARECKVHAYRAQKIMESVSRYTMPRLKQIYRRILLADEQLKTSQGTPELVLDTLVADICRPAK